MSAAYATAPAHYTTAQATQRVWAIRHLWRERAIDATAAGQSLNHLSQHPNPHVASLALLTTLQISEEITR